jgi:hypothetical protein
MQVTDYTVSYGRKVQLDRFEPVEVYESITVALDEDDELSEVSKVLGETVRKNAERNLMKRVMAKKMNEEGDDGD